MKGYKGFKNGLICKDKQYRVHSWIDLFDRPPQSHFIGRWKKEEFPHVYLNKEVIKK